MCSSIKFGHIWGIFIINSMGKLVENPVQKQEERT